MIFGLDISPEYFIWKMTVRNVHNKEERIKR